MVESGCCDNIDIYGGLQWLPGSHTSAGSLEMQAGERRLKVTLHLIGRADFQQDHFDDLAALHDCLASLMYAYWGALLQAQDRIMADSASFKDLSHVDRSLDPLFRSFLRQSMRASVQLGLLLLLLQDPHVQKETEQSFRCFKGWPACTRWSDTAWHSGRVSMRGLCG